MDAVELFLEQTVPLQAQDGQVIHARVGRWGRGRVGLDVGSPSFIKALLI